jgi:hypothetical protein
MSDVMKMDELLGTYQQSFKASAVPAAISDNRDPAVVRRTVIWISALGYSVVAISMISYAFWAAAHMNG